LILDAGAGGTIMFYATWGMFVVTGEPVAVMGGDGAQSAAAKAGSQSVLYVGFRKDGVPVDPGAWWAVNESQKVSG
jgi:septal ring factor EnvC (AmiA/AmiB activator)